MNSGNEQDFDEGKEEGVEIGLEKRLKVSLKEGKEAVAKSLKKGNYILNAPIGELRAMHQKPLSPKG